MTLNLVRTPNILINISFLIFLKLLASEKLLEELQSPSLKIEITLAILSMSGKIP